MKLLAHLSSVILAVVAAIFFAFAANAQTEESFYIPESDLDIPIKRYAAFAETAPILIWLPSSRGTSNQQAITASALGDLDVETWVVDLHMAYFIDPGRSSVAHFKANDISALIQFAAEQSSQKIFIAATDSVAKPALEGIAEYQRWADKNNKDSRVGGVVLFHPNLMLPNAEPGINAEYIDIAKNSTIPIYYIQPSISTRQWHSAKAVKTLENGGSAVFFHPMPNISAGYHLRPNDELSDADLAARENLPTVFKRAIKLLSTQAKPPAPKQISTKKQARDKNRYGLRALKNRRALGINLVNTESEAIQIDYPDHKLNLVSFWASWCEPCIKELPALRRLHTTFSDQGMNIITINVGETVGDIKETLDQFEMHGYTNLLDPEGETMKAWNVYGFPTNFLVTPDSTLSYGSFGAVEWDDAEVREVISGLL